MSDKQFICESELTKGEILAAKAGGVPLVPWRKDGENRLWFRRGKAPVIRAVPRKDDDGIEADADDDDEDADRADRRYSMVVLSRASGRDIPPALGSEILAAVGKTMDDFNADVAEAAEVLAELNDD